jgi:hypothetical protein
MVKRIEGSGRKVTYVAGILFEVDFSNDVDACESYFVFEVIEWIAVDMIELCSLVSNSVFSFE